LTFVPSGWVSRFSDDLFIASLTLAEIRRGVFEKPLQGADRQA